MKGKAQKLRIVEIRYDAVSDPELEEALERLKRHYQQATATSVIRIAVTKHTQMLKEINALRIELNKANNENEKLDAETRTG